MHAGLEAFFITLLVITAIAVAWFAGYVVHKLFAGQR